MIYGWDHPATAERYEQFCERHDRYLAANRELLAHAAVDAGMRVLDLGAGTGRTAEDAVAARAEVDCVEPAAAMRRVGEQRVARARWYEQPPLDGGAYQRVLCGAAAWQWNPIAKLASLAHRLLAPGGALIFNIPSLYLGVTEEAGGGEDPLLLEVVARVAGDRIPQASGPVGEPLSTEFIEAQLDTAGFTVSRWEFRQRISSECLLDWLRIPVLTDALLPDLDVDARDRRIAEAAAGLAPGSWKWEAWTGWTAWKR